MEILPVRKTCPVCGEDFAVPPSLSQAICCSRACADRYQARSQVLRTCRHCGKEYAASPSRNKVFCSRECALSGHAGRKKGPRIPKTCPVCGAAFEVVPSQAHVTYCSPECHRERMRGRPRNFTEESRARLTGRPRKSADETRTCPACGNSFTVPSYQPKKYCSRGCAHKSLRGVPNPKNRQIEKSCPVCGKRFRVPPSQGRVVCCSRRCAGALRRNGLLENVRQMPEGEAMWFAGVFDGEGSVTLSQRRRKDNEYLVISIPNTCLALLERVREVTGVGSIKVKRRSLENPHHLDCWTWRIGGEQALGILRQVRPWLIVKAERTDAALAGETFPRQAKWDRIYPPANTG